MSSVIKITGLPRIGGEGSLFLKLHNRRVTHVEFQVQEPPRLFEALVRGRHAAELPDITARITSLSSVSCMIAACHAVEEACGIRIDGPLRQLRRLIQCGEWLENHALHIYMLHAPDFLGYKDAVQMARDHRDAVERGLRLKHVGGEIVTLIGGRSMHPINLRVGGFYKVPERAELAALKGSLEWACDACAKTIEWTAQFPMPHFERDYLWVCLQNDGEYPLFGQRVISNRGLDIALRDYDRHFHEICLPYSNALHSLLHDNAIFSVGPLARFNLNLDKLTPRARQAAHATGIGAGTRNPFHSILVRGIEALYACEEALRLISAYEPPPQPAEKVELQAGVGHGAAEAPHGLLYHRYRFDAQGLVLDAKIVPPSTQNQGIIEEDLRTFIPTVADSPASKLRLHCEQAIRNYAPCLACATH